MKWNPKKIKAKILRRQGLSYKEIADELDVSVRTVESWKLPGIGPGAPWTLLDADKEDVSLVLDVLAHVLQETHGARSYLTNREAELVAKIRLARPTLPLNTVWYLVTTYIIREEEKMGTEDMDAFLAFAPAWEEPDTDSKRTARIEYNRLKHRLWEDQWFPLPEELQGMRILSEQVFPFVPLDKDGQKPIVLRHGGEGHWVVELVYLDGSRHRFEGETEAEAIKKLREAMKEGSNEHRSKD
jgi:hypothetical protein